MGERQGEMETERWGKASWGETGRYRKFVVRRNRQGKSKRHESYRETEEESQRKVKGIGRDRDEERHTEVRDRRRRETWEDPET